MALNLRKSRVDLVCTYELAAAGFEFAFFTLVCRVSNEDFAKCQDFSRNPDLKIEEISGSPSKKLKLLVLLEPPS